jgi:hypothetical protein
MLVRNLGEKGSLIIYPKPDVVVRHILLSSLAVTRSILGRCYKQEKL